MLDWLDGMIGENNRRGSSAVLLCYEWEMLSLSKASQDFFYHQEEQDIMDRGSVLILSRLAGTAKSFGRRTLQHSIPITH